MGNSNARFHIKMNVMPLAPCSEWIKWRSRRNHGFCWIFRIVICFLIFCAIHGRAGAEDAVPSIRYDSQTHVYRIDGAGMSYIFGVNEKGELQSLYRGERLDANDPFPSPVSMPGHTSFDPSIDATPQEFVAWGGALYSVPDLKITFPDGNRDLVLRYISHTIQGNSLSIVLKDIALNVYVTLEYRLDPATGILRRFAVIENGTQALFTIEQAWSATWNLPQVTDERYRYTSWQGATAGEELYDYDADPEEKKNIAADPRIRARTASPDRHPRGRVQSAHHSQVFPVAE